MNNISGNEVTGALEHALAVLEASQRVLASNVANANTPGYTPTRVSFPDSLRQAMQNRAGVVPLRVTHERHIYPEAARPALVTELDHAAASRTDQSTFDVDREMVELLKNSGKYDILSAILRRRYQQVREVLRIP